MFLHVQVLLLVVVTFQITTSSHLNDEKIDTVDLNSICIQTAEKDKDYYKSPILLIHGVTTSLMNWKGIEQVLALRTGRKVCAVDLRNHGDSAWNNRTDLEAFTADITNFMDKEKIDKVNIIGHSLGGKISVHYTLNNPERVDSLVVEDMRPNGITDLARKVVKMSMHFLQEAIKIVPEGSTEDEARKIITDFVRRKRTEVGFREEMDQNTIKYLAIKYADGKWQYKFNLDLLETVSDDPLPESKGLYEGPALFIYGRRSIFDVDGDRKNIEKLFPNAKLVGVNEAGHTIHGKFKEFEDEVIKFLNQRNFQTCKST